MRPEGRGHFQSFESHLQGLDARGWEVFKAKLSHWPTRLKDRDFQPLNDLLNEPKAYTYLTRVGCTNVHFIPVSNVKGQKTPDLGADDQGCKVLCDVKTFTRSDRGLRVS